MSFINQRAGQEGIKEGYLLQKREAQESYSIDLVK